MRAAPVLLFWSIKSEADGGMTVEPSHQYSISFCCCATDGSRGAVWQNGVWRGSVYKAKSRHWVPPHENNCTHWHSLTLAEHLWTVDVSTVRWWVVRFNSGDSDVKDKLHSGWPCTAVTPQNEECLYQLFCVNWWIMTRVMCMKLNISFSALEIMVAMLDCHKVSTRWDQWMLTKEQKECHRQSVFIEPILDWRCLCPWLHHYQWWDVVSPLSVHDLGGLSNLGDSVILWRVNKGNGNIRLEGGKNKEWKWEMHLCRKTRRGCSRAVSNYGLWWCCLSRSSQERKNSSRLLFPLRVISDKHCGDYQ